MPRLRPMAAAGGLLLATLASTPAVAAPPALVPVALAGSAAPGLATADRLGAEDPGLVLDLQVSLRPIGSPAAGTRPRLAAGAASAVSAFLAQRGLTVAPAASDSWLVDFRATVAQTEAVLGTTIGHYRDRGTGRVFHANDGPVQVPASLASIINGVHGLDNHHPRRHAEVTRSPRALSPIPGALTPADVKSIYNVTGGPLASLPVSGGQADGTGITVALLELDGFSQSDLDVWANQYYPGRNPAIAAPQVVRIDNPPLLPGSGQIEVELDIEVIQAIAPGATIKVYEAPNTVTATNDAYQAIANSGAQAASTSWGLCEAAQGEAETSALHAIFTTASSNNQSWFAASGDQGAFDCADTTNPPQDPYRTVLAADSPASDPLVTAVGGTTFSPAGPSHPYAYGAETAWSSPGTSPGSGSGGGTSIFFDTRPRPWNNGAADYPWQTGAGVIGPLSNGNRQVPDVSSDGDPQSGYSIYSAGSWMQVGGTSAGAPAWAAFTALYDQYAVAAVLPPLGQANPVLYAAAACPGGHAPLHDVVSGNNLYYPATTGWDFATGLGTFNAGELTATIAGLTGPTPLPLSISGVFPASGPVAGGTPFTVRGCGFASGATIKVGGNDATSVAWVSSTQLTAIAPAGSVAGAVNVVVTNPSLLAVTSPGAFTYTANPVATKFFFAEGFTGNGYHETLQLLSPAADASAVVKLFFAGSVMQFGQSLTRGVVSTVDVNSWVGPNRPVSAEVDFSRPAVAERTMTFDTGVFHGATDLVGATAQGVEWNFAEGSTADPFYEYLTLQNPNASSTAATVQYFTTDGATATKTLTLPKTSRTTISVRDGILTDTTNCDPTASGPRAIGCGVGRGIAGVSARVTSTLPIVAERPMYSAGLDFGSGQIRDGHDAFGAAASGFDWYFAEGTTNPGYYEYLTLQNPDPTSPASVTLDYQKTSGGSNTKILSLPPHSRATVQVFTGDEFSSTCSVSAQDCGVGRRGGGGIPGVSVHVQSNVKIVAERPVYMYFPAGPVNGQHDAMGATAPATLFGFAGISTQFGEYDYLTIQNPGGAPATVTVSYTGSIAPFAGDGPLSRVFTVAANSRRTVDVSNLNDQGGLGPGYSTIGLTVRSTQPVLVEKPTYSNRSLSYGATDTPGVQPGPGGF